MRVITVAAGHEGYGDVRGNDLRLTGMDQVADIGSNREADLVVFPGDLKSSAIIFDLVISDQAVISAVFCLDAYPIAIKHRILSHHAVASAEDNTAAVALAIIVEQGLAGRFGGYRGFCIIQKLAVNDYKLSAIGNF